MPRTRDWLALIGLAILTGCSGAGASGATQAQATQRAASTAASTSSAPTGTTGQEPGAVDVCTLMPLADVEARSPFSRSLVSATVDSAGAACRYSSATTDLGTSITLVVEDFVSPADGVGALRRTGQDYADRGTAPEAMSGLGDEAYGIPRPEEAGVWAAVGNRLIRAILKGEWQEGDVPDVPLAAKYAAGTELLKLVIARLP